MGGPPAACYQSAWVLFGLVNGVSQITTGAGLRRAGQTLDKVLDYAA